MPDATAIGRVMEDVTRRYRRAAVAIVLIAAAMVTGAAVSARQRGPDTNDEVLPALLAEVKGLRAAMEQIASAGPRVQLFVGRLQLQEARINGMARRLDTVRDSLSVAQTEYENARRGFQDLQSAASQNREGLPPRDELEQLLAQRRHQVAAAKGAVDRLTAEEAQLTQDVTVEQGRWTEINQRLDELERALVKR